MLPDSVTSLPTDMEAVQVPELVLDRHWKTKNNRVISQLLINWSGLSPALATWEDEDYITPLLSKATACGQAVFQEGRDVTASTVGRPKRVKRPNPRVAGPSWVSK